MNKKSVLQLTGIFAVGGLIAFSVFSALNRGTTKVVVPNTTIAAGTTITSDMLTTEDVPNQAVIDGVTITDIDKVVGETAVSEILPHEQITTSRVATSKSEGYIANMEDSEKNFAIEVPIPTNSPISGINIGDYVAIIASVNMSSGEDSGNVITGQIGTKYRVIGTKETEDGLTSITIEVTPENATNISHAINNGTLVISVVSPKQSVDHVQGTDSNGITNALK